MSWEQVTAWLDKFSDKPIVYITECVLLGIAAAFVIFSKTSFGKKAIIKLTGLYNLGEERAKQTLEKVVNVEKLANEKINELEEEYKKKAEDLKKAYESKVVATVSIVNYYEKTIFSIMDDIPNAKVQAKLAKFKEEYQSKKYEIEGIIGQTYQDFEERVTKVHEEYEDKINFLSDEIKKLNSYINELSGGQLDGEREETEISNSEEERV